MSFCLPKELANKFVISLKEGRIDPEKLAEMTSEGRRNFFKDIVGEADAKEVNALFESKLLLKNQQYAMTSWAKKVANITPEVRRDLISRIEKLDKVLDPKEQDRFLEDLASKRLGTDVTVEEAKQVATLSKELHEAENKLNTNSADGSAEVLDYGAKKVALLNYVTELKLHNAENPSVRDYVSHPLDTAEKIAGMAKGIKASLDDSALFAQGWRTLFTHPESWAKNAMNSFSNIFNQFKVGPHDNSILDGIKADVYSRQNARNGNYEKMKLDIGNLEEAFPSTLPEKIPLFNRLYKASETAYTGFLYRMRADIADQYINIAKQNEIELTKEELRSIGKLVNSLTGRGDLGSLEKIGKTVNTVFFSPKNVKSKLDFLTAHRFDDTSKFAKKEAAKNLLKVVAGTATILAIAKAINPKSVEADPRSSDFGKIKIGDTRFDVSGGMSSLVVLASRLITQSSKSSTSGKINELNTGKFGGQTGSDVFMNFVGNKLSPAVSVLHDIINQKDFQGKPISFVKETRNLFEPLPVTNAIELLTNPNAANPLLGIIADALGIVTNTYSPPKK